MKNESSGPASVDASLGLRGGALRGWAMRVIWSGAAGTIWACSFHLRDSLLQPLCSNTPTACSPERLFWMDRPAVHLEVAGADAISFETQALAAIVGLGLPSLFWLWNGARTIQWKRALINEGLYLYQWITVILFNGAFMETTRVLANRPRPFVYADPSRAAEISNYTSFYSGHTSFAAASLTFCLLSLHRAQAGLGWRILTLFATFFITGMTGIHRVLAGRHFPSDVIVGAFAGAMIAWILDRLLHPQDGQHSGQS